MTKSICTQGFIAVRSDPAESSQLETMLLFGESYDIVEILEGWCRIQCHYDGYEGWIDHKLVEPISDRDVDAWETGNGFIVNKPFVKVVKESDSTVQLLPAGSRVVFNSQDRNAFRIGRSEFYWQGTMPSAKCEIEDVARSFINSPYLWGGKTFFGTDCSGFVQVVFKIAGIFLPRNASQQTEYGDVVSFVEETMTGDLAFFENHKGEIIHVGICLGGGRIIHASGVVRIDSLDHQGIYNHDYGKYTHHLRLIKRVIND